MPARVPTGYRYLKWRWVETAGALHIWFRNTSGQQIVFISSWQYGNCPTGKQKTFQLAGTTVYWSRSAKQQQAWRCVKADGITIQLTASTTQSPTRIPAVGLGRVAASARRVP